MAYPKGNFYHDGADQIIDGVTLNNADIIGGSIDDVDINGGSVNDSDILGASIYNSDITGGTISGAVGSISGTAYKVISVDCTDDYALVTAEKNATAIDISAAGTSKVLTLGMTAGQIVTITNAGVNSVTVKNLVADTGVTATTVKTAMFLVTAGEIIKLTADV
jgi:hypothetical protein